MGAKRRRRIGQALKYVHAVSNAATHLAMPGVDNYIHVYTSCKALGSWGEMLSSIITLLTFLLHTSDADGLLQQMLSPRHV